MRTDCIAMFDGGGEAGTDDRAAGRGGGGSPREGVWVDAVLVRVSCGLVRHVVKVQRSEGVHVRRTRPGYRSFSRSFSVIPTCGGGVARGGEMEDRAALFCNGLEGPSTCLGCGLATVVPSFAVVSESSWRDHLRSSSVQLGMETGTCLRLNCLLRYLKGTELSQDLRQNRVG